MKKTENITNDKNFREYLNSVCPNCLIEHAKANLFYETISEIVLTNECLHKDCLYLLTKNTSNEPKETMRLKLGQELEKAEEDTIIDLIGDLFSKKMLIDIFMEYTDEGTREDIIFNQNKWNQCEN